MNIEDEIINIRTTLARIEGRLSVVYSLPERVSMLEQSQAWLKGAWAVLAVVCAYLESNLCQVSERMRTQAR